MSDRRIVIDCGTTNLRVTLLDGQNRVLAAKKAEGGVRHTAIDGHNGRLKQMLAACIADVLAQGGCTAADVSHTIAYGMITSDVGLIEIPHVAAPARAQDLRAAMRTVRFDEIAPLDIAFIPGVRNFAGAVTLDNFAGMDMMRGEETEAVGLYDLLSPGGTAMFVLPGSHNKFVKMGAQGEILGCMTSISGELLDAVTHDTILADAVGREFVSAQDYRPDMACEGAWECERSGLGRAAFAGRILSTLGGKERAAIQSYLLGASLALDVKAMQAFDDRLEETRIYVAGRAPVQRAMCDVLSALGVDGAIEVPAELTAQMGLHGALTIGL